MNLSMFMKLHIGVKKGKVKMTSDYKHFDYMRDKEWITPTVIDFDNHSSKNDFMMIPNTVIPLKSQEKGKKNIILLEILG
ncbi:hypothetical protein ACSC1U_04960 [Mammaliicoccus lentus]